ncbi:MAG: NADH-quinone oxidoreductase subunit N [Bacteroidia bacterium]|nr:NADH-quinone oxidoreductase subunit N [Bacteroidia bacterium]
MFNPQDLTQSIPLMLLLAGGLLLMLLDAMKQRTALPALTAVFLVLSAVLSIPGIIHGREIVLAYNKMIGFGGLAGMIHIYLCLSGLFSVFFVQDYFRRHHKDIGEVYSLILFAVIGMIMLANANDLLVLFVGLEVMSVCLYIMAGMFKKDVKSNEAGMKYFLLGAFATGFLLYGISMIYGITGTTHMDAIQAMDIKTIRENVLFYPAFGLILIGFFFKIAAFPFHNWTPDVYEGTPTPLTGFMATGSKMAAFIALSFFLRKLIPAQDDKIVSLVSLLALASMLYGNIVAAQQTSIKRMLAYSSIAHTGYLLLGILAGPKGYLAVIFYMVTYTLMTVGAFGIISMVENQDGDADFERWKGIGIKYPALGAAMSTFLFSLAGMPPLAGFWGKYHVFTESVGAGFVLVSALGILTSVIGAYYYIRVILYMYFKKPENESATVVFNGGFSAPMIVAYILVLLIIFVGVMPSSVFVALDTLYRTAGFWASIQ